MTNGNGTIWSDVIAPQDVDVRGRAHGWIQWKGTDACIDLHCTCGHLGHYDGDFLYFYRCPACDAIYALGQNVYLIPLTDEQIRMYGGVDLKTDTAP